ncbi:NmrA-like family protein [Colletotrichum musicola]|uniref:NmrA-like family protein n=1 Tax=Colletotrichum musicola TaxID=2175873 RepID=A0A8H6JQX3_9PEZI|nr:NmrA-like family protein [Colletotrichum musicola]
MVIVAVAGGTGDVGRTIVDQLVATGRNPIVLCRKVPSETRTNGLKFLAVNYDNVEETAKTLEAHRVDTVISAMNIEGPSERAQLNLIAAADKSQTTWRFIPSDFAGYAPVGETDEDEMTGPGLRAAEALAKSGLTFTRVANGMFMDYFGLPNISSHLRSFNWAVNVPARSAAIPGTGDERFSVTYSQDVARFVDRLLDEPEWPEWSIVSGADTCLNELVALSEKITGEKFDVTHDSEENLANGKATPIFDDGASYNGMDPTVMSAMLGLMVVQGKMLLPRDGRLNDRFPDIQPKSVESLMTEAWSTK